MLVTKEFKLEASHVLPNHEGKCARLHGHSWKVIIGVGGQPSGDNDFVLDYAEISRVVDPLIERLDHQHLNVFIRYPSAENIARYIAHELRPELGTQLVVTVKETEKTSAVCDLRDSGNRSDQYNLEIELNKKERGWDDMTKKIVQRMDDEADIDEEIGDIEDEARRYLSLFEAHWNRAQILRRFVGVE